MYDLRIYYCYCRDVWLTIICGSPSLKLVSYKPCNSTKTLLGGGDLDTQQETYLSLNMLALKSSDTFQEKSLNLTNHSEV